MILKGTVRNVVDFGVFVDIGVKQDGLVHISQLAPQRIAKVEDEVNIGDEIVVKVVEIDPQGRVNLTRKGVTPEELAKFPGAKQPTAQA